MYVLRMIILILICRHVFLQLYFIVACTCTFHVLETWYRFQMRTGVLFMGHFGYISNSCY